MTNLPRIRRGLLRFGWALPVSLVGLAACSDPAPPTVRQSPPQAPASAPALSAADERLERQIRAWAPELRAAYLEAQVRAAAALYQEGQAEAARALVEEKILAAPEVLTEDLPELGYRAEIALALAEAEREEAETYLEEIRENLETVRTAAEGDAYDTIRFLISQSEEAYRAGIEYGVVRDFAEYAGAYGFAAAARDLARQLPSEAARDLQTELDMLVLMWPDGGPLPDSTPAPEAQIAAQISRVRLALAVAP